MKYVISYTGVLLPQSLCQLQWHPKYLNPSIMNYYRLKSMLFTDVLTDVNHTFLIRAV
jgi:hypothetical protein